MVRIAWFAPRRGYAAGELVRRLQTNYRIDCYLDRPEPAALLESGDAGGATRAVPSDSAQTAHEFVWTQRRRPYDLTVFEIAGHTAYDFVWPYLVRYPGLVLLHEGRLHETRGRSLLREGRRADYLAEFSFDHPDAPREIPTLAFTDHLEPAGELWPMRRVVVESSRWLVSPHRWLTEELRAESSHSRFDTIEPGVPAAPSPIDDAQQVKQRYGIPGEVIVFAMMGLVSERTRLPQVLSALSQLDPVRTPWHLVCANDPASSDDAAYHAITQLGLTQHVTWLGSDRAETRTTLRAMADVCVCLQWPDRADGHWEWLDCLAAGKPAIVFDLADRVALPTLDPRSGLTRRMANPSDGELDDPLEPVAVGIDIVDEQHSLRLAVQRLASDRALRTRMGDRAQRLWQARFQLDRMAADVDQAIGRALDVKAEDVRRDHFPIHLFANGSSRVRAVVKALGIAPERLWDLNPAPP